MASLVKVQGNINRCIETIAKYADIYQVTYICTFAGERITHAIHPSKGSPRDTIYINFSLYKSERKTVINKIIQCISVQFTNNNRTALFI